VLTRYIMYWTRYMPIYDTYIIYVYQFIIVACLFYLTDNLKRFSISTPLVFILIFRTYMNREYLIRKKKINLKRFINSVWIKIWRRFDMFFELSSRKTSVRLSSRYLYSLSLSIYIYVYPWKIPRMSSRINENKINY
jgi:hypothetical protein